MRGSIFERIANYLYGYVHVRVEGYTSRALTAMLHAAIDYCDLCSGEGYITFDMPIRYRRALLRVLSGVGCTVDISEQIGVLKTAYRYRHRPGIVVGAFVFAAVLWASTRFVWDISVTGNEHLSEVQIIESFAQFGLEYGSFIPAIDLDRLCHEYLIASDDMAWVSVNMEGTRANIVVKERADKDDGWYSDAPSDVIAAEDGQIVTFAAWSGVARVHLGQVVKKGDLLIAGTKDRVENGEVVGYDTVRSYGTVQAQVFREYTVEIPLTGTHKVYTGEQKIEKRYKFFTKALKSFGNSGNNDEFYDKIEGNERL
ncbi:MAG: sporulation protein YqfD [Clostridia bacterium]|nr:sporulation protein YqfD [Clostridia bacterium]